MKKLMKKLMKKPDRSLIRRLLLCLGYVLSGDPSWLQELHRIPHG